MVRELKRLQEHSLQDPQDLQLQEAAATLRDQASLIQDQADHQEVLQQEVQPDLLLLEHITTTDLQDLQEAIILDHQEVLLQSHTEVTVLLAAEVLDHIEVTDPPAAEAQLQEVLQEAAAQEVAAHQEEVETNI